MDKKKRLSSVDSTHDIEDLDDRPSSSMSVEKDLNDTDEKVDIEGPATPAPFLRPPRSSPGPQFLAPPRQSVKTEVEEQTSLVSPLVSSASSPLPQTDTNDISNKLLTPPVSSSDNVAGGGTVPILPHEPSLASHPTCLPPYAGPLHPTNSIPYPYLYYSQLMSPLYLGRSHQLPIHSIAPPTSNALLEKTSRDVYNTYPYLRPPSSHHPSALLSGFGGPPRPIPLHNYNYAIPPQVPANP